MLKAAHLGSHQSNIHKNVEFDVEDAKDVKDSREFEEDKIQNNVEHVSNVENFSIFLLIQLSYFVQTNLTNVFASIGKSKIIQVKMKMFMK